jgi:PAS domain S-box-containing protein
MNADTLTDVREAFRQSDLRFRTVFEAASDAMALSDAEGIVVDANPAYYELYGYTAEEVIGHSFSIIFPEDYRTTAIEQYKQVFKSKPNMKAYESSVRRKDGTVRIVESRAVFLTHTDQRTEMLSIIRDLTEQKQAEQALRIRYELTNALALGDSVDDVVQIMVEQLVQHLGAATASIYMYHEKDDTIELFHTHTHLPNSLREGWQLQPVEPALPVRDVVYQQKALWFSSAIGLQSAYPSREGSNPAQGDAVALLPLIIGEQAFGVLALTFTEQRNFDKHERDFIGSLVHQCAQTIERARLSELSKALAVIEERQRLARELHDEVSQTLFSASIITEALPRLWKTKPHEITQQLDLLLLLTKGASAEMRTLLRELRPEGIVQIQLPVLLAQLAAAAQARKRVGISISVHGDGDGTLPPDVHIVFYRIAQESINNALKHAHASQIKVQLRQTSNCTVLVVADNGRGFDMATQPAGYGLGMMQERAEIISAVMDVKSTVRKGTRIRLAWSTEAFNENV